MDDHITVRVIGMDQIEMIRPLWQKLNALHLSRSRHFKPHYACQTFEARFAPYGVLPSGYIRIEIAEDANGAAVGYCVCSLHGESGELDSIYIEAAHQNRGLGTQLASNGIAWLKENGCGAVFVSVADGNESAFAFYRRLGFAVRKTVLQLE